ncbi:hypothetical protein B0T16DRAFT_61646 [Cercophora newfieldiana]|uniref:Uncharacterized protein n=1 Tax=Cercophora newfieldiana TaxID=92897 RepID=A0AA39YRV0_9PEZI|nr:hypothetical protein B0T16DRAFT_61646 [Cercophora newfieldiana]
MQCQPRYLPSPHAINTKSHQANGPNYGNWNQLANRTQSPSPSRLSVTSHHSTRRHVVANPFPRYLLRLPKLQIATLPVTVVRAVTYNRQTNTGPLPSKQNQLYSAIYFIKAHPSSQGRTQHSKSHSKLKRGIISRTVHKNKNPTSKRSVSTGTCLAVFRLPTAPVTLAGKILILLLYGSGLTAANSLWAPHGSSRLPSLLALSMFPDRIPNMDTTSDVTPKHVSGQHTGAQLPKLSLKEQSPAHAALHVGLSMFQNTTSCRSAKFI